MDVDSLTLEEVISLVKKSKDENIQILPREKNEEFMFANAITQCDAKDFIRSLSASDYIKGPVLDIDPNRKHYLWIFKKYGFEKYCYIKLKVINGGKVVIVVSFHEDEW